MKRLLDQYLNKVLQGMACVLGVIVISFGGFSTQAEEKVIENIEVVEEKQNTNGGWNIINGKSYYLDEHGNPKVGLQVIGHQIYLFNNDGSLYRGWITLADRTFYFDENGAMQTGKCVIDGNVYQFLSTGDFITGWYEKNGNKYYRDEYGFEQVGMVWVEDNLYYITANGVQIGKLELENIYYTDENGKIYTGDCLINGKEAHFTNDGQYLYGWNKENGKFIYQTEDGVRVTGKQNISGKNYYFDENGNLLVNTTIGMYKADEQGVLTRMPVSVENLDAALDEILMVTGNDIAAIGNYVSGLLRYKYMDKMATREEMAVYAINNKRCSCYYYEALYGLLLERLGYELITIHGEGFVYADHYWSLIKTERNGIQGWYHVDALKKVYVKTDAEMVAKGFKWRHEDYPATP